MGTSHAPDGETRNELLIKAMTDELRTIRGRHQLISERADELAEQIEVFKRRQVYARAALEESRRIAAEISDGAQQRVAVVMKNVNKLIEPQQAEIARLEAEIAELKRELESRGKGEALPESPPLSSWSAPALDVPEELDLPVPGPYQSRDEQRHSSPSPQGRISVLELQRETDELGDLEPTAYMPDADTRHDPGAQDAADQSNVAPQVMDTMNTYIKPLSIDEKHINLPTGEMIDPREYSLPEPRRGESPVPVAADGGSGGAEDTEQQPRVEMNLPPMSVVSSERTELSYGAGLAARELIEERENSSIMHLDVFLDTRHHHFVDPWNKQMHRHRWQVKVQAEVPANEGIAYSQLLSAVNATLLKYDGVLLNEVFPFDHLDPSHENIAGYFFNCLEDLVVAKGVRLVEVSLWEKQNLMLQVHSRNGDIDTLLRGENDLEQIRESIFPETSASAESSFRKMLGMMFKNRA